jgi:ubiquinone/menaquinone biosynthesis C-methylase UbiE
VAGPGGRGRPTAVNAALDGVARAYDASAAAWVAGPAMAYDALADALLAAVPVAVPGARVLDVGAGTGSAARAARRAGAGSVVGVDIAAAMLSAGSGWDALALCDAGALPFRSDTFDVAVAAFCLGQDEQQLRASVFSMKSLALMMSSTSS